MPDQGRTPSPAKRPSSTDTERHDRSTCVVCRKPLDRSIPQIAGLMYADRIGAAHARCVPAGVICA